MPEEDENEGDYSAEDDPTAKKTGRVQTLYIIKFDPEVIKREVNFN